MSVSDSCFLVYSWKPANQRNLANSSIFGTHVKQAFCFPDKNANATCLCRIVSVFWNTRLSVIRPDPKLFLSHFSDVFVQCPAALA